MIDWLIINKLRKGNDLKWVAIHDSRKGSNSRVAADRPAGRVRTKCFALEALQSLCISTISRAE